ncbi:FkbM family methyltransferase [Rickettsiales bacterium LUAb2]
MKTSNYTNYTYDPFIQKWQSYYHDNFLTFNEELELLKQNLDDTSIKEIDNFIQIMLFKLKIPSSQYLIKKSYIYSDLEISKIKQEEISSKEHLEIIKKYNLPTNFHLEIPVFRYHCGLKLLPKSITDKIYTNTVLDGGAYFGDSALIFNKYKPKNIYAFEPCSVNYNFLQQTITNNHLANIIRPINFGLGDKITKINLGFNSFNLPNLGASSVFNHANKNQELINITTIDNFVSTNMNNQNIALIKLDLEGFELEAIMAAKQTIIKYKPILLIAVYHSLEELLKIKPYLENLNLGYKFLFRTLNHGNILREMSLIAYIDN